MLRSEDFENPWIIGVLVASVVFPPFCVITISALFVRYLIRERRFKKGTSVVLAALLIGACAPATKTVPVNVRVDMNGQVTETVEEMEIGPEDGATMFKMTADGLLVPIESTEELAKANATFERFASFPLCPFSNEKLFIGAEGLEVGTQYVCGTLDLEGPTYGCDKAHETVTELLEAADACVLTVTRELKEWSQLNECKAEARQLGVWAYGDYFHEIGRLLVTYNADPKKNGFAVAPVRDDESFPPIGRSYVLACLMHVNEGDRTVASISKALQNGHTPH